MNTLLFYIPLWYTYCTRLRTPLKCISLVCIYLIPILIVVFGENQTDKQPTEILFLVLLSVISVYSSYEIGYIQNDTETIQKEEKPTLRLSLSQLEYYHRNRIRIYLWRAVCILFLQCICFLYFDQFNSILFLLCQLIILFTYQLYNCFRGNINMPLYFILVFLRYFSVISLFTEVISAPLLMCVIFIFPLVKTLEFRSTKPASVRTNIYFRKYILGFKAERLTKYRVISYFVLSIISILLYIFDCFLLHYLLAIIYMFIYRCIIWMYINVAGKLREYLVG